MCNFETTWDKVDENNFIFNDIIPDLKEFEQDELISIQDNTISVKNKGKAFIRNICMAFDLRLKSKQPDTKLFSMTI